ncbi:MAG: hypothetical protein GY799_18325 [Desulfobulbaceae bacterium]|nr:hypothetical protein [Desulfobulbaceae bacterium]
MSFNKLFILLLVVAYSLMLAACEIEESRPSYNPIENTLPKGGELIKWSQDQGLLNISNVEENLNNENRKIFSKSLEWYATESDLGFEHLSGKTAKQTVDITNCLKTTTPESQKNCVTRETRGQVGF